MALQPMKNHLTAAVLAALHASAALAAPAQ
jgi:hypothetical protein